MSTCTSADSRKGFLSGLRVLELADEHGEYCGRVLAGLGADVVKVEPPEGEVSRRYGPFVEDVPDREGSLYFWHYNLGKRSAVIDLDNAGDRAIFADAVQWADVLLDAGTQSRLEARGWSYGSLREINGAIVYVRITPFGSEGPWAHYKGSDLIHLALGGIAMNCGYDPLPDGTYDTPPVAPQMWQSYHLASEAALMGILGALIYRDKTGVGQELSIAVHDAVSKNTELDLPNWLYSRQEHHRQTCRHSSPQANAPAIAMTKDGRWLLPYRTYLARAFEMSFRGSLRLLRRYGMQMDLDEERFQDPDYVVQPPVAMYVGAIVDRFIGRFRFNREIWREAQAEGMPWAPLRRPEENLGDDHWRARATFTDVFHSSANRVATHVGARWWCDRVPWQNLRASPTLGQQTDAFRCEARKRAGSKGTEQFHEVRDPQGSVSKHGKPFALSGLRVVDLSWLLASGGAGRFLAALGAEVIKVEHKSHPDTYREGQGLAPAGGRAEREQSTEPLFPPITSPNRSGNFMEANAGKRSLSLNLKDRRGVEILEQLIKQSHAIVEGFSPGTLARMGLDYARLRDLNPSIVYVQQSGMGERGTLGAMRSYGPTAQALSGISEMSGLPEPFPPAGIGYSYLDWFGAYNVATAVMAGLYRRQQTGEGCHIDASQTEVGIHLTGSAIVDFSVNGRRWKRYGNSSPYKLAAPHGVYRARADDRWIAVACFTEGEWDGLTSILGASEWSRDTRFLTIQDRLANQGELDRLIQMQTVEWDAYELMAALQARGVPAGVCQTAEDRYETDPQLAHLNWTVELKQTEIGIWPVREFPVKFSTTPAYMGGIVDRHGPSYGEDSHWVLSSILGLEDEEIARMGIEGVT